MVTAFRVPRLEVRVNDGGSTRHVEATSLADMPVVTAAAPNPVASGRFFHHTFDSCTHIPFTS